jgi:hypothetical protein
LLSIGAPQRGSLTASGELARDCFGGLLREILPGADSRFDFPKGFCEPAIQGLRQPSHALCRARRVGQLTHQDWLFHRVDGLRINPELRRLRFQELLVLFASP